MSNVNEVVMPACPEFPVQRYARELLDNVDSPVLSSRLVIISENLDRVIEHSSRSLFSSPQLDFILDVLSTVLVLSVAVLRYKSADRSRVVENVVYILDFIASNYPVDEFPQFCSTVPRETVSEVNPTSKKNSPKKV